MLIKIGDISFFCNKRLENCAIVLGSPYGIVRRFTPSGRSAICFNEDAYWEGDIPVKRLNCLEK